VQIAVSVGAQPVTGYDVLLADIARVIEEAQRAAARSVNAVMTATTGSSVDASSKRSILP
jgi:hypothetical protein